MSAESRSPSLEDAYAEGRKDEREAIVAMLRQMYRDAFDMEALRCARLIEQMDIQKQPTS